MSMFMCIVCDQMRDSDDGCEQYKNTNQLICADCMAEEPENDSLLTHLSDKTDMSREGIYKKLIEMGCPADIADELAREKGR